MANWCFTDVSLSGPEDQIKIFDKAYREMRKNTPEDKDVWLGSMLMYTGLSEDEVINGDVPCRGVVYFYESTDDQITLNTYTAWEPIVEPIVILRDRIAPDLEIIFTAEEPGNGVFVSNDPAVYNMYLLDYFDEVPKDLDFRDYVSKDELYKALEKALGKEGEFEKLLWEAEEKYGSSDHYDEKADIEKL